MRWMKKKKWRNEWISIRHFHAGFPITEHLPSIIEGDMWCLRQLGYLFALYVYAMRWPRSWQIVTFCQSNWCREERMRRPPKRLQFRKYQSRRNCRLVFASQRKIGGEVIIALSSHEGAFVFSTQSRSEFSYIRALLCGVVAKSVFGEIATSGNRKIKLPLKRGCTLSNSLYQVKISQLLCLQKL